LKLWLSHATSAGGVDVSNQALNSFHESEQMNRSRDKRNLISCCGGACKQAIGSDIFGEQQHVASGEVFSNPGRHMNPLNQLLIRILRTPAFSGKRTKYTYCDHKLEQVVDLKDFTPAGYWGVWLGLDPNDSPLMTRDTGTQDVYSLDWQEP